MPRHTAAQIFDWVYAKKIIDPAKFSNIAARHRRHLAENLAFHQSSVIETHSASDGTRKMLLQWPDRGHPSATSEGSTAISLPQSSDPNRQVECVMIPSPPRYTACISSQIGCPVGCRFCASGLGGLDGNLTTGQIIEQVHRLNCLREIDRLTNIVFMGMGEPLANFNAVTSAIRTINSP
ncbi:MAG TPA: hypothetical protein VG711_11405, partial [Phycisphaerales bacterium]|nr:hypothetical protein [Phycisphaerales bacterium]